MSEDRKQYKFLFLAYQGCDLRKRKLKGAEFSEFHGGRQMISIGKLDFHVTKMQKKVLGATEHH